MGIFAPALTRLLILSATAFTNGLISPGKVSATENLRLLAEATFVLETLIGLPPEENERGKVSEVPLSASCTASRTNTVKYAMSQASLSSQ